MVPGADFLTESRGLTLVHRALTRPWAAPRVGPMDSTIPPSEQSEAASEAPLGPSSLVARYEILEKVAQGGMGAVYRGRHKVLGLPVAIKRMLPGAPADRFLREARILARINSPHVVGVHDFDVLPDGSPMLVMDWIDGRDLRVEMASQGGRLSESSALTMMRQVCEGMFAAAEQGIIHRDLKPSNILIDGAGRSRVADFGLARGPAGLGEISQSGLVMGTPFYMAPEQAEDPKNTDTRADIYSFGATFYHALAGTPPFEGETAFAVLFKHKTEPLVALRHRAHGLSDRTCEVVERCLAKAPQDRFPGFDRLLNQLQPALTAGGPSPWEVEDESVLEPLLSRYRDRRDHYVHAPPGLEDLYELPRDRRIRVKVGDIVLEEADAIVSSDNDELTMQYGVSLAIRNAAGPRVPEDASRFPPVLPGRVVVTQAGDLKARFIFHAVTNGSAPRAIVRPSRDLISELVAGCFYHADSLHVTSIVLPLMATGGAGFPRPVAMDTLFLTLARQLSRGMTSVREARIVLYPEPDA